MKGCRYFSVRIFTPRIDLHNYLDSSKCGKILIDNTIYKEYIIFVLAEDTRPINIYIFSLFEIKS